MFLCCAILYIGSGLLFGRLNDWFGFSQNFTAVLPRWLGSTAAWLTDARNFFHADRWRFFTGVDYLTYLFSGGFRHLRPLNI